jgi:hypothetical protein
LRQNGQNLAVLSQQVVKVGHRRIIQQGEGATIPPL